MAKNVRLILFVQPDPKNFNSVRLENFRQIPVQNGVYLVLVDLNVQVKIKLKLLTWSIVPLDLSVKVAKHKNVMQVDL